MAPHARGAVVSFVALGRMRGARECVHLCVKRVSGIMRVACTTLPTTFVPDHTPSKVFHRSGIEFGDKQDEDKRPKSGWAPKVMYLFLEDTCKMLPDVLASQGSSAGYFWQFSDYDSSTYCSFSFVFHCCYSCSKCSSRAKINDRLGRARLDVEYLRSRLNQ